jgi:exonuclease SbcC
VEKALVDNTNERNILEKTMVAGKERLDGYQKNEMDLKNRLHHETREAAEQVVNNLKAKKDGMEKELIEATQDYDQAKNEWNRLVTAIQTLERQIHLGEEVDVAAMEAELRALEETRQVESKKHEKTSQRWQNNLRVGQQIQTQHQTMKTLEERWNWVKALADTANGTLRGKEKIMLETYIQMTYFDRIIARANTRFMTMTSGQYELMRKTQSDNQRSQTGLELDVVDHYNGSVRSVKTLSGGESFKASLSLALGLADEIQASAGGIRLDTMFVDEGFGSLDEESLDQAIKALHQLSEGKRLVGIISHVTELKNRLDRQIVVKKNGVGGSTVRVEA